MKNRPFAQARRPRSANRPRSGGRPRRTVAAAGALLLAAALAVAGCSGAAHNGSGASKAVSDSAQNRAAGPQAAGSGNGGSGSSPGNGTGGTKTPALAPTYLVRTADLTVRTPHVADRLARARALATAAGGYSGDENTTTDSQGEEQSTIQLRVPPAAYDKLLDDLAALGTQLSRKVSVNDVTGQVVDVDSRIKSQQASVARVRKLMDQAGSITDVVSLESELSTREAALESLQAQQSSLKAQTALATVTLYLVPPTAKPAPPKAAKKHDGFWQSAGDALGGGWHAFYLAVRGLLVVLSAVLPFLALALLCWYAFRLVRRWWPRGVPAGDDVPNTLLASLRAPRAPEGPPVPSGALPPQPDRAPERQPEADED